MFNRVYANEKKEGRRRRCVDVPRTCVIIVPLYEAKHDLTYMAEDGNPQSKECPKTCLN